VKQFDLLPVTPVFAHRKNAAQRPGYYSDIIMHTDVELDNILIHYVPDALSECCARVPDVGSSHNIRVVLVQENRQIDFGLERQQFRIYRKQFAEQQSDGTEAAQGTRRELVVFRQHDK